MELAFLYYRPVNLNRSGHGDHAVKIICDAASNHDQGLSVCVSGRGGMEVPPEGRELLGGRRESPGGGEGCRGSPGGEEEGPAGPHRACQWTFSHTGRVFALAQVRMSVGITSVSSWVHTGAQRATSLCWSVVECFLHQSTGTASLF